LLKRLYNVTAIDRRIIDFLNLCPRTHYSNRLKEYGISERQFERKFLQAVGFTPSFYRRVVRFEKVLHKIQHNHYTTLADLAYESGYTDQSHLNREFKQFSGSTPLLVTSKGGIIRESGSIVAE